MANLIINPWKETPGEKSLRQKGFKTSDKGIMETGLHFGADMLRKDKAGEALQRIARSLWELKQQMASLSWDDEKVCITVGMQARNGWVQDSEGEWIEEGSEQWLQKLAKQAEAKVEQDPTVLNIAKEKAKLMHKSGFVDDAAKHIMGCMHSLNAMGTDVVTAARHSYKAAEALWDEKMKGQK